MSGEGEPQKAGATLSLVEDLFLTDSFLIKGRLSAKFQRLTRMLEESEWGFISVEDAMMASLRGNEVIRTPRVLVNTREIILAHELLDVAGDAHMRKLASNQKTVRVRAFYNGAVQLEIAGNIEPGAYKLSKHNQRKFFIVQGPMLRGLNLDNNPELRVMKNLSYAIVQKQRLAYIYDFS